MNRERLKILRDHLVVLPDERVDMRYFAHSDGKLAANVRQVRKLVGGGCGTAACVAGWATTLFRPTNLSDYPESAAQRMLGLSSAQADNLFYPKGYHWAGYYTRTDAIAAIDSMLANPDDEALPVWPEKSNA